MRRAWGAIWRSRFLPIVAGVAGVLGVLWLALVAAPPWFVQHRSLEVAKAQNEVRTTLLQGLGGVVLLVGAYFTYRQVTNSRAQLQIAKQGQITERFTRAIDQLGNAQLDVRLGGIYALERIARDSPADRATIGEVLTAFIRTHAPWPPSLPGQYVATAPLAEVPELQVRAPDVQASLTVLGRGGFARPEGQGDRLDLHAVDLRRANLTDAHMEWADLGGAHLEGAGLAGADLEWANLGNADLRRADLEGADLTDADLEWADLGNADLELANLFGADLRRTDLTDADLRRADLEGADLRGARLKGADLRGVDLVGVDLRRVHIDGALADERTAWPAGFDWHAAGVIVEREEDATNGP